METESLAQALQREHQEIDAGIAAFAASPGDRQPLTRAIRALRRHIYLEEEFLFPLLCRAEPGLAAPTSVMLGEHARIWAILELLEQAPDSRARLALGKQLTSHLLHHNLKEEKVLYPPADDILPPAAAGQLRAFISRGDLPEGWVCLKARPAASDAGR